MEIKNLRELDFSSQRAIIGGAAVGGCSCTCSCSCNGKQKSNSIDNQADGVKENVSDQMKGKKF